MQRARDLAREGRHLLQERRHHEAEAKLQEARQVYPDEQSVALALRKIAEDQKGYRRLKANGERHIKEADVSAAMAEFRGAMDLHPELAAKDGLPAQIERLSERSKFDRLLADARQALAEERWQEAGDGFQQVLDLKQDHTEAQESHQKAASMVHLENARRLVAQKHFQSAEKEYGEALELDPGNQAAQELLKSSRRYNGHVRDGRWLRAKKRCPEARRHFLKARRLDPDRFRSDRLDPLMICESNDEDLFPSVEVGLLALMEGRPKEAIDLLEVLVGGSGKLKIHLQAYLGVAYSQMGLSNEEPEAESMKRAREYFGHVLDARADYQLSDRLFSSKVLGVFEEVREELQASAIANR